MIGGYAFVDAEVRKDNNLPSGTPLANIPRNNFSLLNVYEFQGGAAKGLGLGLAVKYVDERAGQTSATSYDMQGYGVMDLLSFYKLDEHVRLNLDVKNLFNEEYEEGAFNLYAYPGAPRTVQLGIAYTF
ncbi:TonB-dependent siderophore receptor [compost metagenome]